MSSDQMATRLLFLPGLGSSDAEHWQTLWGQQLPTSYRFKPGSWDAPELSDWIQALDSAIDETEGPVLLVAHSLSCLLVAHWAHANDIDGKKTRRLAQVRGAFLVAAPDPASSACPPEISSFRHIPTQPLAFPALVITSSNDPYATSAFAHKLADAWQAGFVNVGDCGHINAASQLGEWPQGWALLQAFRAGTR